MSLHSEPDLTPIADLDQRLRLAAARDEVEAVAALIGQDANPYAPDAQGRTALNAAASNGLHALRLMVDLAFRDTQKAEDKRRWSAYALNTPSGIYGSTLLTYAAKVSPPALVREMIEAGADLSIVNGSGWTLLHCAAVMPGRRDVLGVLVEAMRVQGRNDLLNARTCHIYETDYDGSRVVYGENLSADDLCRARLEQDPACPPELADYLEILPFQGDKDTIKR